MRPRLTTGRRLGQRPRAYRPLPAAHGQLADEDESVAAAVQELAGRIGDEERGRRSLRQALEAGRGVRRVADRGVLEAPLVTDVAGHERSAVQPDSHPERLAALLDE